MVSTHRRIRRDKLALDTWIYQYLRMVTTVQNSVLQYSTNRQADFADRSAI